MLIINIEQTNATSNPINIISIVNTSEDSLRLLELDIFWKELSRTVEEGDFEGYAAAYHKDAVVVFASGKNKKSVSISKALAGWKQGFLDTKDGKTKDAVEFRFSQRIGDATTAHETGIFIFESKDGLGNVKAKYITHFEMLLVKKDNVWYAVMEYQKSEATLKEWEGLK